MAQMFEIWTNEDASEFAAKLSGTGNFIIKTNLESKYSRILYAAPLVEQNVNGLAKILAAMLREMDKPDEKQVLNEYDKDALSSRF